MAFLMMSMLIIMSMNAFASDPSKKGHDPIKVKITVVMSGYGATVQLLEDDDIVDQITIADKKTGTFVLEYDEPESHQYKVKQLVEKPVSGVTYQDTGYVVDVFISTDEDGVLDDHVAITDGKEKLESIIFNNTKTVFPPKPTPPTPQSNVPRTEIVTTGDGSFWVYGVGLLGVAILLTSVVFVRRSRIAR